MLRADEVDVRLGELRLAVVALATALFTFLGGAPSGLAVDTGVPPPAAGYAATR